MVMVEMGWIQERRGEFEAAMKNYADAAQKLKSKNDEKNYAEALINIGDVHYYQRRHDEALRYYSQDWKKVE